MNTDNFEKETLGCLELASVFAGKNDIRQYLNDVLVKQVENNTHIVACDGHCLIKIEIANCHLNLPERIVLSSIKDACKVKNLCLIRQNDKTKDMNYPEYERLIPKDFKADKNALPKVNAGFMSNAFGALSKAAKRINGENGIGVVFESIHENDACLFTAKINDDITASIIIMPMRK